MRTEDERTSGQRATRARLSRLGTPLGLVAIGAVLAGTGTAVAATGGTFILGRSNTASTTTVLKNTGSGAALSLPANSPDRRRSR